MRSPLENPLIIKKVNYYIRLKRLVAHMKDHINEPMPLGDAACIACMEKTAFSKFFSKVVGMTYRDFVQQWRIALAVDQMLGSDCSLTDAAIAAGFSNMSSFERTFKKLTSMTPSQYRKGLLLQLDMNQPQEVTNKSQHVEIDSQ